MQELGTSRKLLAGKPSINAVVSLFWVSEHYPAYSVCFSLKIFTVCLIIFKKNLYTLCQIEEGGYVGYKKEVRC